MTIRLTAPQRNRNYFEAAFSGVLTVLEAIGPTGPNIPNVLANLKAGFSHLKGVNEDEPQHRAWVWAFKTVSYAAGEMLKEQQSKAPLSTQKDVAVQEFLEAATQFDGQELDILALTNPGISPIFAKAQKAMGSLILKATTGSDLGVNALNERFKQTLRSGSYRTLCEDPTYFRVLEEGLTGLAGEGARRDGHWARHAHWISQQYTDAAIFSPDEDEIIPLEAVYLPLRCFWHKTEIVEKDDGTEELRRTAHVADLHHTAHKWLSSDTKQDTIRVVTGGPGSGKSSFARAFAHEVIVRGKHRVLFLQLQHIKLTGSLYDDIARYIDRRDTAIGQNGSPGLPGNPLEWRKTDDMPLLMIFDGLDELSTKEEDGERFARELLLSLKLMLSPMNADGSTIRALVLGRNLACQAAMAAANIPLECMLNAAPIAKLSRETCVVSAGSTDKVQDADGLMDRDQREDYWLKWAALKGLDPQKIPDAITARSMRELNVEPLLLHLLLVSKYSGSDWEIAADNKNVVYEDILQKIFERNRNKDHFQASGIDQVLFFEFMECLGIAAWRGNGRTGDENDFRQIRKLHLNREKKFKDFPAASLKSVALNIHTRAGQEDPSSGFEFIHKSFGEYLAARGLLSHALKTARVLEESEPEDVELQWCQIVGFAELTPEILTFLYNEARLNLTPDKALVAKDALTQLINWVIIHGFSVPRIAPESSWTDLNRQQRCAVSALIASASAMATAIPVGDWETAEVEAPWTVNIDWDNRGSNPLKEQFNNFGVSAEAPIIGALRRINISDQELWDASLSRTNLEGADLRFARITWSLLIGTNLARANLSSLDAKLTRLRHVDMSGCDLLEALFDDASFEGVDMKDCNLRKVSFRNVNASKSTYPHANIYSGSSVRGSIDLKGADLQDADLSNADLSGVVNLSLEALNSAFGTKATKLPDYIDRSKVVWNETSEDQERAAMKLRAANRKIRSEKIKSRRENKI